MRNAPFGDIENILFDTLNRRFYTPSAATGFNPPEWFFPSRLGVAERGRRWQWCQVPESSFEFMLQTFQIGFLLENSHLQALVYPPPTFPISFLCLLTRQCCILCACVGVGWGWGGAVCVHRHPCITMRESTPRRLVNIFSDFILAAIE